MNTTIVRGIPTLHTQAAIASSYAFFIYGKLQVENCLLDDGSTIFSISSDSILFKALAESHTATMYRGTLPFIIPLAVIKNRALTSLYGLTNEAIYKDKDWPSLLEAFNRMKTKKTADKIFSFLDAAARAKVIAVSGSMATVEDPLLYTLDFISINYHFITGYFMNMIREWNTL